jgi:iron complex outermembrane receptor protein
MKRILLFICSLYSLGSLAQKTKDSSVLDPVEVRAIRAATTAPFAKTNIGKKEIERQNLGQDLPFLLNQTPSTVINSDAGNGVGYTGIRIRGTDASRINVTLNGIPYNDAESSGTFFVDLPDFASSVSSIQIQRGVGTSSNGAGAFGATINISTNEVNKSAYGELNNSFGSFNTWKNTIKVGTGLIRDHFTADLRLSRISSDGYIDRASSKLRSFYFSTAYLSKKSDLRLNVFSGKEKTYQAWYGVSEADLPSNRTINYAGTEKPGEPYDNETDNYRQDHYQLFFTHRLSPAVSFNIAGFMTAGQGYYEQYKAEQDYTSYDLPYAVVGSDTIHTTDLVRQLWLRNKFYGTVFSLQRHSQRSTLNVGGAFTQYDGAHYGKVVWASVFLSEPKKYYDLDAFKRDFNLYGKWQQDLSSSLQLFADLQFRRINYNIEGFESSPSLHINEHYDFFNPKIGFSFHGHNWLAYASYSESGKEPNRDDFETGLSEKPSAEYLRDLEVGLENKSGPLSWSVNFYYMHYRDQLVLTGKINNVGAYTRTNIPKSYRAGIEIQGTAALNGWLKASANLTFSKNKILEYTEYLDDYDNGGQKTNYFATSDISFSPAAVGAATVTVSPIKKLSIDLVSKYVGKQYLDNTGNENRKLDAYFTEDIRAIYFFKTGLLKNTNVVFQVNNVFNERYEPNGYTFSYYAGSRLNTENYYFPMAGINWMVGLNIKL